MRCRLIYCGILFLLLTNVVYSQPTTPSGKTSTPINKSSKPVNAKLKLNQENVYANASLIYALMGDGGLNSTSFAQTISASGQINNYMPNVNPNLGYEVVLGYKMDPNATHLTSVTYTRLNTSGTTTVNTGAGGQLFNNITQSSNATFVNPAFHVMFGPANATAYVNYGYENIVIRSQRPYSDDGGTSIKFYHVLALRYMHLTKNFQGQYNGLVTEAGDTNNNVAGQDLITYNAHYYGLGPHIGAGSMWRATDRLAIKGGGAASILAGFYNSSYNESATAAGPVDVSPVEALSSYTDSEIHPRQAWIPAIFEAHVALVYDIITARPQRASLAIEGGFFLETILPIITNDSISQVIGQSLVKLNNNLNMSSVFISINSRLD